MADTVTDVLQTVWQNVGLQTYLGGFQQAGQVSDAYGDQLASLTRQQQEFGLRGAAAFGVAATGLRFLRSSALAAGESQAILNRASGNFKGAFPTSEMADFSGQLSRLTGVDDEAIASFVGLLGTFNLTKQAAKELALPILNASEALKAQGVTAEQVAVQIGKAMQGGKASGLRRVGIFIDEKAFAAATTQMERARIVAAALQRQGGNAAATFRDSLPGALQAFTTELGNANEVMGSMSTGPFRTLVEGGVKALQFFNDAPPAVHQTAQALAIGLTVAAGAYGVAMFRAARETGKAIIAIRDLMKAQQQGATVANQYAAAQGRAGGAFGAAAGRGGTRFVPTGGGVVPVPGGGKGGLGGKVGGALGAAAGIAGLLGGEALFGDARPGGAGDPWGLNRIGKRAVQGAGIGFLAGPKGALAGAALGAGVGAVEGIAHGPLFDWTRGGKPSGSGSGKPDYEKLAEIANLLKEQNDLLRKQHLSGVVPTSEIPYRQQAAALAGRILA
jgi:hypothetical protein